MFLLCVRPFIFLLFQRLENCVVYYTVAVVASIIIKITFFLLFVRLWPPPKNTTWNDFDCRRRRIAHTFSYIKCMFVGSLLDKYKHFRASSFHINSLSTTMGFCLSSISKFLNIWWVFYLKKQNHWNCVAIVLPV